MVFIVFAIGFKYLTKITVHFRILSYMYCFPALIHGDGIRAANQVLNSKGKLLSVFPYWKPILQHSRVPRGMPQDIGWLWLAENGGFLDEVLLDPIVDRVQTRKNMPLKERITDIRQSVRAHRGR